MRYIPFLACTATLSLGLVACAPAAEDPADTETAAPAEANNDMTPDSIDIVEAASANDNLSTFLEAALQAGIAEQLATTQGLTVFAPINEAFEAVEDLDAIMADPERLTQLLQLHVVPTEYLSRAIPDGETTVETLAGATLTIRKANGQVVVVSPSGAEAMVVEADIDGDNGVVHAINTVLTP